MRFIWSIIHKTNFETANKARLFLLINTLWCGGFGFAVWLVIQNLFIGTMYSAMLFTLCPAFFVGMLGGMWYLYRYDI